VSPDKHNNALQLLQKLRRDYAAKLPATLQQLLQLSEQLSREARSGEVSPESFQPLHHALHKLAGAAGSFGFNELSVQARVQESKAQLWQAGEPYTNDDIAELHHAIGQLPLYAQKQAPASGTIHTGVSQQPQAALEDHVIYLLEDDVDLAAKLQLALGNFGYRVQHYATLEAAEQAVMAVRPDFLIVDVMFDGDERTGPDSIIKLQRRTTEPLPVVFISSRNDFDAYLAAVRAGAVGYFVKPLDVAQLVNCLETQLQLGQSSPHRVLLVDDDALLARHYQIVLQSAGMQVEVVTNPREVLEVMRRFHPELVLLDLNLPECHGYEIAQLIRLNPDWLRVAVVYLSSENDERAQAKAVGYCGEDFLTKPISDLRLISAVSVRAARSRQLSEAIDRDGLTGLLTHARIKEQLQREVQRSKRMASPLSVAMLDLDHFKKVNDTYGHATGDRVIRALAQLLRQRLRQTDVVGRYGGEEFVVILTECPAAQAEAILNDIRESFAAVNFIAGSATFNVTLSAGVACNPLSDSAALLELADQALYRAKAAGRDCVMR
jgi:diguanylate cyclase (GGDEF)-like protein